MATDSSNHDTEPRDDECNDCEENDSATQKTITRERLKYCDLLYQTAGEVTKNEKSYLGQWNLFENKKCMFVWTEDNYHRYRNTDICVGAELLQSNDIIKTNVANDIKWGTDLSMSLKNALKSIKDAKTKMNDLREAACKLENCISDSCNCTQMIVLTGKVPENCKGDTKPPQNKRPAECDNVDEILDDLVCMPKALAFDIDTIFKSSSDVIGIQVFSNLGTLDPLQKTLSDQAKAFEQHLQDTTKTREADMKKMQEELVKCVQDTTKAEGDLYNKRSDFEGTLKTLDFICCPKCNCVSTDEHCEPRLKQCECEICDICDEVQKTFCHDEECNDEEQVPAT